MFLLDGSVYLFGLESMCFSGRRLDISKCSDSQKAEILKYASEIRKFEIERFWQRSLFFWGFISAAFIAYAALYSTKDEDRLLPLIIACFGAVCGVAWTLQNRGNKYWQEAWEQKVEAVELDVLGTRLFSNPEPVQRKGFWGAARYSVSKLAIALSDFTILIWIALGAKVFPSLTMPEFASLSVIVVVLTVIYVAILLIGGRSTSQQNLK
jgi:hypothetical protein